jgi:uncharacterized membrane protein
MKNRNVGFLIVGVSLAIFVIIMLFNFGLKNIVDSACDHGSSCAMHYTIALQTGLSLVIAGLVLVIGVFLIFSKENERVVIKRVKERMRKKKLDLSGLDSVEKKVVDILRREKGAFFQKSIMEEIGVGKVKMTRMMDRLEARGLIERKRRGMNNIVVLIE